MATAAVAELDKQFGIPGSVKVCTGNGALPRVFVSNSHVQGEIYLYGAQVTSWKPAGHEELIFVSSKSSWQEGQAIRGGVPICFPWFRGKVDDPHAPALAPGHRPLPVQCRGAPGHRPVGAAPGQPSHARAGGIAVLHASGTAAARSRRRAAMESAEAGGAERRRALACLPPRADREALLRAGGATLAAGDGGRQDGRDRGATGAQAQGAARRDPADGDLVRLQSDPRWRELFG